MKILITGGASGLGKSITELLSKEGHDLIITYNNSIEEANKLQTLYNLEIIHCDFSSMESVIALQDSILNSDLDILINNAWSGIQKQYFHKQDAFSIINDFQINVLPVLEITRAAILKFRKNKSGKIINILSSAIVNKPPIGWSTYVANKNYLLSMSKSWASENIKYNITSNAISPAFMKTPLNKDVDSRILENMVKQHPLKKILKGQEVAEAVSYLVNCSLHINGINMVINAGENVI